MILKYKKIPSENGKLIDNPKYQTAGSACFDLVCNLDDELLVAPNETVKIPSGIAIELESNAFVALVFSRSGLSSKFGVSLANGVGVIDSDYRGEVLIALTNHSDTPYTISPNERIAQLGIIPVMCADLVLCDELSKTERGGSGFGSTGK